MKRKLLAYLTVFMLLAADAAFAAASRSAGSIEMGDEELTRLSAWLNGAALIAWQNEYPLAAVSPETDGFGALIYALDEKDGLSGVSADLYRVENLMVSAQEAPEDSVTWLANMQADILRDASSPEGFSLVSLAFSPPYSARRFNVFQNTQAGYEIMLPDIFPQPSGEPSDRLSLHFVSADGRATLDINVSRAGGESQDESRGRLTRENPALIFEEALPFSSEVSAAAPGESRVVSSSQDAVYSLTLRYPPELEAEYGLYFQFMRNSFVISEIAVG